MTTLSNASCECSGLNTPNENRIYAKKFKKPLDHQKNFLSLGSNKKKPNSATLLKLKPVIQRKNESISTTQKHLATLSFGRYRSRLVANHVRSVH